MDGFSDAIGRELYKSWVDARQGRLCPYEWMCLQAEYSDMDLTPMQKELLDGIRTAVQTIPQWSSGAAKKLSANPIGNVGANCYSVNFLTVIVPCMSWREP